MKLKYKKIIIMVSMCTMGIGLVTFSMVNPPKKNEAGDVTPQVSLAADLPVDTVKNDVPLEENGVLSTFRMVDDLENKEDIEKEEQAPVEEVAEVVEVLEKNSNKDINKLIKKYLNAKLGKELTAFEGIVNDTSFLDMEDMIRKNKYIEGYDNIDVYTKKGPKEGSFIVYAYHEVKFTSIDTLAPAMNEFYLETGEDDKLHIYLGKIDTDTSNYLDEVRNSEEVMDLIYTVNDGLQKAVNSDTALAEFYIKLEESAQKMAKGN